jgi:hypothetical protein
MLQYDTSLTETSPFKVTCYPELNFDELDKVELVVLTKWIHRFSDPSLDYRTILTIDGNIDPSLRFLHSDLWAAAAAVFEIANKEDIAPQVQEACRVSYRAVEEWGFQTHEVYFYIIDCECADEFLNRINAMLTSNTRRHGTFYFINISSSTTKEQIISGRAWCEPQQIQLSSK